MSTLRSRIGERAERKVLLNEEAVRRFADGIGDHNPLHLDPLAAAATTFRVPIVHGMFLGSLFSGLIAERLPGPGSVYLSQALRFRRPVPVGSTVTARMECLALEGSRMVLATTIIDATGEECVVGEATVLIPNGNHDPRASSAPS